MSSGPGRRRPEPGTAPPTRRGRLALCLALLFAANLLPYAPSARAPFVFDDFPNILNNPAVRDAGAGRDSLLHLALPRLQARRPLAYLSFALNLRLCGLDPFYFHLVNLAIHICNSWLLFFLILSLLKILKGRGLSACALAGALLWSLHPLQVQAVTYIVQRMTLGATFFYFLALLLFLRARARNRLPLKAAWALGAVAAGLLGFFCKEILLTLPLVWLLVEIGLVPGQGPRFRRRSVIALGFAALAVYLTVAGIFGGQLFHEAEHYSRRFPEGLTARLLTQARVMVHYLSLLAFPDLSRFNLLPQWTYSSNLFVPPTTLPAVLAILALIGLSAWGLQRRTLAGFAGLFFFAALLPEAGLYPLDPAFDHRLYLPSVALLAGAGAAWVWPGRWRRARLALLLAAVACLLALTFRRNSIWSDEVSLWRDTVKKSPASARAWGNLAKHLTDVGQYQAAVLAGQKAVQLDPCAAEILSNLGGSYLGLKDFDRARQTFDQALRCQPDFEMAKAGLELAQRLQTMPQGPPAFPPPAVGDDAEGAGRLYRRGFSRLRDGRYLEGIRDLEEAVRRRPDFPEAKLLLEEAKRRLGENPDLIR